MYPCFNKYFVVSEVELDPDFRLCIDQDRGKHMTFALANRIRAFPQL